MEKFGCKDTKKIEYFHLQDGPFYIFLSFTSPFIIFFMIILSSVHYFSLSLHVEK